MNTNKNKIGFTLEEFLNEFGLTVPPKGDLLDWWKITLGSMDEKSIKIALKVFYDMDNLVNSSGFLKQMQSLLITYYKRN